MNKYFILSTHRSGTEVLRHMLLELFDEKDDGPDEWVIDAKTRKNLGLPEDYNAARILLLENPELLVERMSPHSHRKIMYRFIKYPKNLSNSAPVIHLIRKDSWAQAKSYWIMKKRAMPAHIRDEDHNELLKNDSSITIEYKEVEKWAQKFYKQKQIWYHALKRRPKTLLLYYEEDIANEKVFTEKTIPRIEEFLEKKRKEEEYYIPFKKTRNLYKIQNLNPRKEAKLTQKYYFTPSFLYGIRHWVKKVIML